MFSVTISNDVSQIHAGTGMAFLMIQAPQNIPHHTALEEHKLAVAEHLRTRFPNKDAILMDPVIAAYQRYYQQFKSNYHVRYQIESVAIKGKALPERSVLVDAMFMAELKYAVLIAGHDAAKVKFPLQVDCTQEGEFYITLSGEMKALHAGDLCIRDGEKLLSTILYGPEQSSPITMETTLALYTIYGPGVATEHLSSALNEIADNIKLAMPEMEVVWQKVVKA